MNKELIHTGISTKFKYDIPDGACDCHHHIYDPNRFPYLFGGSRPQPAATAADYAVLKDHLHLTRNVIVQPFGYWTDNRCTLDALSYFGKEQARAIAVIDEKITDEELSAMNKAGVRGIRFNIMDRMPFDPSSIDRLAERIAPMNWSIHFWMNPDKIAEWKDILKNLPCQIVFDHLGHIPHDKAVGANTGHPAVGIICDLMQREKAWVKLSGIYLDTACSDYSDTIELGRLYVSVDPGRCLWGTDWPHPTSFNRNEPMPDDAAMLNALMEMAGSKEIFDRILVDNPTELFGPWGRSFCHEECPSGLIRT